MRMPYCRRTGRLTPAAPAVSAAARLTTLQTGPNNTATVQNDAYTYDALGNLFTRSQLNSSGALVAESFSYDPLNRLVTAQVSGQSQKTYAYDDIGNLTCKSDVASSVNCAGGVTHTYPASGATSVRPHAVSSIAGTVNSAANPSFTYDANGNLVTGAGRTFTWMSFNLPLDITKTNVTPNLKDSFV